MDNRLDGLASRDPRLMSKKNKGSTHLQPVLHLNNGAVEVGGGKIWGDGDHLGGRLLAGRLDGLHLLLQDVVGVEPPSALREEAPLFVQG